MTHENTQPETLENWYKSQIAGVIDRRDISKLQVERAREILSDCVENPYSHPDRIAAARASYDKYMTEAIEYNHLYLLLTQNYNRIIVEGLTQ